MTAGGDIALKCDCGAVRAVVHGLSPQTGTRIRCYCRDCQAFAHFLSREDTMLDRAGGTDILQTLPSRVEFTSGADRLAAMRLSDKGLFRWHTSCCRSPIGNTVSSRAFSFVGLIVATLGAAADGRSRDAVIGPSRGVVHAEFARTELGDADSALNPGAIGAIAARSVGALVSGAYKKTPFFAADGSPIAVPRVLAEQERAELYAKVDARR